MVLAALALLAAGCLPPDPPPPDPPPPDPPAPLQVTTDPGLFPEFDPAITDYVARCGSAPVQVAVDAPTGSTVAVAGQAGATGHFVASVSRTTGESFTIVDQRDAGAVNTYDVRCLPLDFPTWTVSKTGPTQAEYYITAPSVGFLAPTYPAIYDDHGVPIWWGPATPTLFPELLPDGNIAWTRWDYAPAEEHRLDGSLVASVNTQGGSIDMHDLLLLPNGNYVVVANVARPNVDFTSWGGPASASLLDHIIEEVTPTGTVVWSWDVADHIPVSETDPQWRAAVLAAPGPIDAYHWNSVEATGSGFLLSFRHLDAVYNIDQSTADIVWKLGGTSTPQSLTVDDPVFAGGSHFGGQHDARILADGTVTLYDDGTNLARAPRAVRYQIDTSAHTATMLEQVVDPIAPASPWGGDARRLDGGDWVVGWGGTNNISELDGSGTRVFLMQFTPGNGVYRVVPVAPGVLNRDALRAGMDAQYP